MYARSKKLKPDTVDLGNGAQGHWVGNKNAKHVLIWYHGGGFCLPANIGYFKFLERVVQSTNSGGGDLAVFALTYTLAPHARYPTQLSQAVAALRYVVEKTGHKPGQVLLGGDSAGGNLVFGVLSHLAHPHPRIDELKLSEPLAGAAGIAPWTSLDPSLSEQAVYYGGDIVTPYVGRAWGSEYLNGVERDYYTDASDAPTSWFETYPVKQILILGGANEILLPVIEDFAGKIKVSWQFFPLCEIFWMEKLTRTM
jgi:acetyl esterase/lipase